MNKAKEQEALAILRADILAAIARYDEAVARGTAPNIPARIMALFDTSAADAMTTADIVETVMADGGKPVAKTSVRVSLWALQADGRLAHDGGIWRRA